MRSNKQKKDSRRRIVIMLMAVSGAAAVVGAATVRMPSVTHAASASANGAATAGHGNSSNGTDIRKDSGVRQIGDLIPSTVPEPAAWAMLVAGFGGIGVAIRRRRRYTVSA